MRPRWPAAPYVLNVFGVGGIGKTRLLTHLAAHTADDRPRATLDLQVPVHRQQLDALASLRASYGTQDVDFDRFDIAYAVLWQRLHPQVQLGDGRGGIIDGSDVVSELASAVGGIPLVGTAAKLLHAAGSGVARWHRIRHDPILIQLDDLSVSELSDAVTYVFAGDVTADGRRPVLFVDAYEALIGGLPSAARSEADTWLRDLVSQLNAGVVVVASREPLEWTRTNSDWLGVIKPVPIDGLPDWASRKLLAFAGMEASRVDAVAEASDGVPYYLLLAAESDPSDGGAATHEAILELFLRHVDTDHIRALELLACCRTFERGVFDTLGEHFDLPHHTIAWERVTGYSFVHAAGSGLRLHRLMAEALYTRLSSTAYREVNDVIAGHWTAFAASTDDGARRAAALAEAAYHGLRAGWASDRLLANADRIVRTAPAGVADGFRYDLDRWLTDHPDLDLSRLAVVLDAEAALLHGATYRAAELSAIVDPFDLISARSAVAHGHARRILGDTGAALDTYLKVSTARDAQERFQPVADRAGYWAADLSMATGDFASAIAGAHQLLARSDHAMRSDLHRLLHLAYRFSFDFPAAARHLEYAEVSAEPDDVVAAANLLTNRVELEAMRDPRRALAAFDVALAAQAALSAEPELGKLWCGRALAQLALGDTVSCLAALGVAIGHLERAGYRSGRARAELYRAVCHGRTGDVDAAIASADWAAAELDAASVYPTLVVAAVTLCERLGQPSPARRATYIAARNRITFSDDADLDERVDSVLTHLLGVDSDLPLEIAARSTTVLSGFYNRNVRVNDVVVRTRIPKAETMDLAIWEEADVLAAVGRHLPNVPRLLAFRRARNTQLHSYVPGDVVDDRWPKHRPLPGFVIEQTAAFLANLSRIPTSDLPPRPDHWPLDGDCTAFASRLSAITAAVEANHRISHGRLWNALGIPDEPLATVDWTHLGSRPFQLVHSDIHRKNMIVSHANEVVFLDWELALWGDPIYEVAVHLHKMRYAVEDETLFATQWREMMPAAIAADWPDLEMYRAHERVKSALVDSVRYSDLIAAGLPAARQTEFISSLTAKLNEARDVWGLDGQLSTDDVERDVSEFISSQTRASLSA